MAQQHVAGFAVFVVLAFFVMALAGCAGSAQVAQAPAADAVASPPEFHDAHISGDALRDRLGGE